MYYDEPDSLFVDGHLSSYLDEQKLILCKHIQNLDQEELSDKTEDEIVAELITQYQQKVPIFDQENQEIEASEGNVEIYDPFDRGIVEAKGIHIVIKIPFIGNAELFRLRPSTWSISGTPEGRIRQGLLIINHSTTDSDPELIKQAWKTKLGSIKQNLNWIAADLEKYNEALETDIRNSVSQRKKEASKNQELINSIKLG